MGIWSAFLSWCVPAVVNNSGSCSCLRAVHFLRGRGVGLRLGQQCLFTVEGLLTWNLWLMGTRMVPWHWLSCKANPAKEPQRHWPTLAETGMSGYFSWKNLSARAQRCHSGKCVCVHCASSEYAPLARHTESQHSFYLMIYFILTYVYGCASVWQNVHMSAVVCGGQKKPSKLLELGLEVIASSPVWALRTQLGSSGREARALSQWTTSPAPVLFCSCMCARKCV